jgi:amino acid transporter/mannitol/fructose-specific phosphotransferase system IIA component (Ntr-type)
MALQRKLGMWHVFCLASGAMISSGLFVLPGQAFKISGPAMVLAYALAALMVVPALLSQAELATAMPKSGGSYFFIERSMGALPGTLAGLANWLSIALKAAFAMIGIGAFARLLWPAADLSEGQWEWLIKGVAIASCLVFMVLNMLSVKTAAWAQAVMVAGLLAVLVVFVAGGAPSVRQHPNFDNFLAAGWQNVLATSALVFVSFGGLTKVASVAEEVRPPGRRNIAGAMFLAWGIVSLFYVAAVFVTVGVLGADKLGQGAYGSLTPLSLAAGEFLGPAGTVLLSAAAILAFVTTGNSGILAASRSPLAMSRDGLLPGAFRKVSKRFGTPYVSVLATAGFMIAMIAALSIRDLVKVASTMMLILFLLVNVAVLIMRTSRLQNYRPSFRCPLFPWVQIAGIGLYAVLIALLAAGLKGVAPLVTAGVFGVGSLMWYVLYVHPRTSRESALVHLVRRVTAKEFVRSSLEDELREIALERDEIVADRFDHMVRGCRILDLHAGIPADDLFRMAAAALTGRLGADEQVILAKLRAREADSSTVLQPGLAIPHIVVDGQGVFEILPVRCRDGIIFDPQKPPVHTAFILAGSPDERNYHLRVLMAIAHIVQEHHFNDRWQAAAGPEALRDILLLSGRKRDTAG